MHHQCYQISSLSSHHYRIETNIILNREERLDSYDIDYLFNNTFKAVKKRDRGELSYISNKMMHILNGNRPPPQSPQGEVITVSFTNVPGKCSDQNIEIAVKCVLDKQKPGLLGIAEPSYEKLSKMYFPGYKLIKGKLTGGKHFRLNVLVKDSLINYSVESFTTDVPSLLITSCGFKYLFFYREWRRDGQEGTDEIEQQEQRWSKFLSRAKKIGGKLFMLGDANICYLTDDTAHQKRLSGLKEEMFTMLAEKGYAQIVKEDTRHQKEQRGCLDHIYTSQLKNVARIYNENIHGWDHNTIGVMVRTDAPVFKRKVVTIRHIDKVDPDDFHQAWVQSNPQEIFETKDVERMIEILEFKIKHTLDIVAPEKRFVTSERYAPWVDREIKTQMEIRDQLRKDAIAGKVTWAEHDRKKHEVKEILREAESAWKEQYLNFSDEKTGWRRLKAVSGLTQSGDKKIALMVNGVLEDDPEILAEYMNNYFIEKIEKITDEFPPDPVESTKYDMEYFADKEIGAFEFKPANYRFVKSVIMKMNNVDSTGIDGIPVIVYKRFRSSLTPAITRIINTCINYGIYPDRFKRGTISPVPKKGNLSEVSNWRPVVLLPVMSRILEGVLMRQMMGYLEGHNLLPPTQHAYRQGKSCISMWEDIDSLVNQARDQGKAVGLLMTDLAGAFNALSKHTLIPKLRMAGFSLHSLKLLECYLTGRMNSVKIESFISRPRDVPTGCGEGSSSGPILWLCHILNSSTVVKRTEKILEDFEDDRHPFNVPIIKKENYNISEANFADDINNVVVARTNAEVLQIMQVLQDQYSRYFSCLGLKESRAKQQHIIWSRHKEEDDQFLLNNRPAESSIKLLGLNCSSDYCFEKHASIVAGKMVARLPYITRVRKHVSREVLIRVSTALVLSYLQYGVSIWGQKVSIQRKLQRIMNMLLRVLTDSGRERSVKAMLAETDLLNVHLTYQYFCIMGLERLQRTKGSLVSYNLINWNFGRTRFTRVRHLLLTWRPKTNSGWFSTIQQSAKYFNKLQLYNTNWFIDEEEPGKALKGWLLANNSNANL